jgi:hypothetical protein
MIDQLSHPAPDRRADAIRQLAKWGPAAFPELRRAAKEADLETALSARDLLRELEGAILIGARVRLQAEPAQATWNEPVTLIVTVHNPTADPIRLPWSSRSASSTTRPAGDDPMPDDQQVAALLDAGEYLTVHSPRGQELAPRVDPLERDAKVMDAVQIRAGEDAPCHELPPGQTSYLLIPGFNRGWARYPMLEPGRYTIAFAYQPQWDDENWIKQEFGLVRAEPITLEITGTPPPAILLGDVPMRLILEPAGDVLEAAVENLWDRPQWINLNLNGDLFTHGKLEWTLEKNTYSHEESLESPSDRFLRDEESTGPFYKRDHVKKLDPAERLTIARIGRNELIRRGQTIGLSSDATWRISLSYIHIPSPPVIRMNLAGRRRSNPDDVPVHLYTGHLRDEFHFDPRRPGLHPAAPAVPATKDE